MSLQLLILRHAKSDWNAGSGSDHERPLNERGRRAAAVVGRFLSRAGKEPELVLSSPAVRARTTVEIAADAGSWSAPVELVPELYGATAAEMLDVVRERRPELKRLLLAGHEPGCSELVEALTGSRARFPTAALARVDFALDGWGEVDAGAGQLRWLVAPKLLAKLE